MRPRLGTDIHSSISGVALYRVLDESGFNLWAQWTSEADLDSVETGLLELVGELRCLHPSPDRLWIQVVDEHGWMHTAGMVPGEALRSERSKEGVLEWTVLASP